VPWTPVGSGEPFVNGGGPNREPARTGVDVRATVVSIARRRMGNE
jgi:hypothetical protein